MTWAPRSAASWIISSRPAEYVLRLGPMLTTSGFSFRSISRKSA